MKDIRFVVVHTPGPAWQPGVPAFEQDGLQQRRVVRHVQLQAVLLEGGHAGPPGRAGRVNDDEANVFQGGSGTKGVAASA